MTAPALPLVDRHRSARTGTAMALGSMLSVQIGLATAVGLVGTLGAAGVAWLRLCWGAVLVLLVVVLLRRRSARRTARAGGPPAVQVRPTARVLLACTGLGVVTAAVTTLFMEAVARLPLGTAVALEFLGPLAVAVLRGRGRARAWAALAAVGVALLTQPWHGVVDPAGVGFALGAAICWAAYILLTQQVGTAMGGISGLAVSMPVAAVAASLALLVVPHPPLTTVLTPTVLLAGLGLAVLVPAVPFALEMLALQRLPTAVFGTLMCLEPAFGLLVGLVVLHQLPDPLAVVGLLCVVGAGLGVQRTAR